jgi:hypothetical protein
MERVFSFAEARALMVEVHVRASQIIAVRAELAERAAQLRAGERSELPEVKGLEAQLSEALDWFGDAGIDVKGWAPLLIDFPVAVENRIVLACWLENEPELAWYHELEHGFAGRRLLDRLGLDRLDPAHDDPEPIDPAPIDPELDADGG